MLAIASKMEYNIQFGSNNLKVNSIDKASILNLEVKLSEFRFSLPRNPVVGLSYHSSRWLILCSSSRCLMVDTHLLPRSESLKSFLADKTICFVAPNGGTTFLLNYSSYRCKSFVELGYLAARILKKAEIRSYDLQQLASEVGIDLKPQLGDVTSVEWCNAMFFTAEQMKCAVHQVFYTSVVASTLLAA